MDLAIHGRHALFFDDDSNSSFVNSSEALVPWGETPSLLIDRYDVRHLLPRIPPYSRRVQKPQGRRVEDVGDGIPRAELDRQRYLDLPGEEDEGKAGGSAADDSDMKKVTNVSDYQAVSFSYNENEEISVQKNNCSLEYSGYHPPFPLPQDLQYNLPHTEKLHQIIAKTAVFVSKNGGQSEIILRVKQGDNPTFGFLMPEHQLHPYFRYLVNHPELVDSAKATSEGQERKSNTSVGALSLLGSVYGSGDDDGEAIPCTSSKMGFDSSNNVATTTMFSKDEGTASTYVTVEDKVNLKPLAVASNEKSMPLKKSQPILMLQSENTTSGNEAKKLTSSGNATSGKHQLNLPVPEKILEPSSSLKRMIDKIVEFIVKNGKEFEAILIEQDRSHGRFPFLLPSSIYHSYYLKVLREAEESKILGKNIKSLDYDSSDKDSRKDWKRKRSTAYSEKSQDGMYDPENKEKFKMVLGASKKDAAEMHPKPAKQSGVSADAAAAIVMAATRGLNKPNRTNYSERQSSMTADAVAAIVLQATRGSSSPPLSTSFGNGICSSMGGKSSVIPPSQVSMSKHSSDANLNTFSRADLSGSSIRADENGSREATNVIFANVLAKTAAIAAASEADSSEASLTKEQKLKAERLKKAKLFAAMIKSSEGKSKLVPSTSLGLGSQQVASASVLSCPSGGTVVREREGSSVPVISADIEKIDDEKQPHRHGREHKTKKHKSSRYYDDHPEDHQKITKSKHHSEHSSHHHRKRHHSYSNHDGSDIEEASRHKKSSRSRHHKHHDSSDDEYYEHHKSSLRHQRKSNTSNKPEIKDSLLKQELEGECTASREAQPSHGTEVSDELRAKVRAMLLSTM